MATKLNNRFVHFRGPQDGRFLLWHGDHERAAALQRDRQRNRLDLHTAARSRTRIPVLRCRHDRVTSATCARNSSSARHCTSRSPISAS